MTFVKYVFSDDPFWGYTIELPASIPQSDVPEIMKVLLKKQLLALGLEMLAERLAAKNFHIHPQPDPATLIYVCSHQD